MSDVRVSISFSDFPPLGFGPLAVEECLSGFEIDRGGGVLVNDFPLVL
jgi:hypothetical protein